MIAKKELALLVLILVVGGITYALNPRFLSAVNIINMANLTGIFGIFALGVGLVIISGGIELSVGAMFALLGVIFLDLLVGSELHWLLALGATVGLGLVLGLVHGLLVTRAGLQPFVVTLCGLLIYRGIARYYTSDATQGFGYGTDDATLRWLMSGRSFEIPHTFMAFVLLAGIMAVVLHGSVYGRHLFATGKNEEAARYSGIDTTRVVTTAYVLCGGLAGLAAVFIVFYTNSVSPSSHGNFYELYAIAAAVLGGCSLRGGEGSILGIMLGVVLLQVLQNLVNLLGIPSSLNFAVMGSVILLGVLADQEMTRRRARRLAAAGARAEAA
ncbi:MAG: ABC transporter permease [Rhodobacteraceae bacterium]|jgi:ribose transport system permease protein|nr:ABC transporter permease [Paracoccaceae bacterium]